MYGSRRPVPPELLLASFVAVGFIIWRLRRRKTTDAEKEAEIFQELPEEEAWVRIADLRFARSSRDLGKSAGLFALSAIGVVLLSAGFPLHAYVRPWGPLTLAVCFFFFMITVLDAAFWVIEGNYRREIRKIRSTVTND